VRRWEWRRGSFWIGPQAPPCAGPGSSRPPSNTVSRRATSKNWTRTRPLALSKRLPPRLLGVRSIELEVADANEPVDRSTGVGKPRWRRRGEPGGRNPISGIRNRAGTAVGGLTDRALSCRPPVSVPRNDRRPPGVSATRPGGRRLEGLAHPGVAAGQLQCLVRQRPR
jgi:hypothetical protein